MTGFAALNDALLLGVDVINMSLGSGGGFAMSGYGLGPGFFLVCIDYERILREGSIPRQSEGGGLLARVDRRDAALAR